MALLWAAPSSAVFFPVNSQLGLVVGNLPTMVITGANPGKVTDLGGPGHPIREEPYVFGTAPFDVPDSVFTGIPNISDLRIGVGSGNVKQTNPDGLAKPAVTRTFSANWSPLTNRVGTDFLGSFGGTAPLVGTATICFGGCAAIAVQVPLSVGGVGGTVGRTAFGSAVFIRGGGGWTVGPAQVTLPNTTPGGTATASDGSTIMVAGRMIAGVPLSHSAESVTAAVTTAVFRYGPDFAATATPVTSMGIPVTTRALTLTGGNFLGSNGIGTVSLVTPMRIDTGPLLVDSYAAFAIQSLAFVPEPGTVLLLGAGVLALGAAGRSRMR